MSESEIQSGIMAALKHFPGVWLRMNTGSARVKGKVGRISFGCKGMADIMGILPYGKTVFLEVKAEKGAQSEEQVEFQERLEMWGHRYRVVRSVDEAVDFVTEERG